MAFTKWVIFMLHITLPSEYALKTSTSDKVAFQVGPPGSYAIEEYRQWQTPSNQTVSLFYWDPRAPRSLGTIIAAQEYPITIDNKKTQLIETSEFMGRKQHVLVAHLQYDNPEFNAMIVADGLTVSEFKHVLSKVVTISSPGLVKLK